MKRTLSLLALLVMAATAPVVGQQGDPCPTLAPPPDTTGAARQPDVLISAAVRAREVRFRQQPRVSVRLLGCAALDTVQVRERRNLPEPVQPGVTYRDVFVAVDVLGYIDARCLLRELQHAGGAPLGPCPWTARDSVASQRPEPPP